MGKRRKYRRSTGTGLILIIVIAIFSSISYGKAKLDVKRIKLLSQIDTLEQQLSDEELRSQQIDELGAYVQTKKYVEDMAREKFGLVYKDEVVFQAQE